MLGKPTNRMFDMKLNGKKGKTVDLLLLKVDLVLKERLVLDLNREIHIASKALRNLLNQLVVA